MISPLFFGQDKGDIQVMLCFSVDQSDDAAEWCQNLSSLLDSYNLPATVFVDGKTAQEQPQTVACFNSRVDVGSRTYSNTELTSISDYVAKLKEVQAGKSSVDQAGDLNSKSFQAPNGATDQDIYSLLNRSGILADFSYSDHYNVYQNGQFVRNEAYFYDGQSYEPEFFLDRPKTAEPVIIQFSNNCAVSEIKSFLSTLLSGDLDFVNASQLTGLTLTDRAV
jgi:peptidoglycan/xylan/chitin deacetylase (PgdA/CDA1 family)